MIQKYKTIFMYNTYLHLNFSFNYIPTQYMSQTNQLLRDISRYSKFKKKQTESYFSTNRKCQLRITTYVLEDFKNHQSIYRSLSQNWNQNKNQTITSISNHTKADLRSKEKGRQALKKSFNNTRTDSQHNFVGKKYLNKIEEQRKKTTNKQKNHFHPLKYKTNQSTQSTTIKTQTQTFGFRYLSPNKRQCHMQKQKNYNILKNKDKFRAYQERIRYNYNRANKTLEKQPSKLIPLNNQTQTQYQLMAITPWEGEEQAKWLH